MTRVTVVGGGAFGRLIADSFAQHSRFSVVVLNGSPRGKQAPYTSHTQALDIEHADVLVIAASAVPGTERRRLASRAAPIENFWALERQYNLGLFRQLLPSISLGRWRLLAIATNPVHDWVNALHTMFRGRSIVGLGSAFDDLRIRYLTAAMSGENGLRVLNRLRIVGGHGEPLGVSGGTVSKDRFQAAKWMSNFLSVGFIQAPTEHKETWWRSTSIDPFVRGIAGTKIATHLIVPVRYRGVEAASAVDVIVQGFQIRARLPRRFSASEEEEYLAYLHQARLVGAKLAQEIGPAEKSKTSRSASRQ
jgi:hypothetical protein